MARPYFRQVPNFEYVSRNKDEKNISQYVPVKNLFKRGKLREDIFGNLVFFEKYSIKGDERPDNVAYKIYGDETLDWVILIANNILNIQTEWPMTQASFDKIMLEKYGSYDSFYSEIHHYETIEFKNSLGIKVIDGGIRISPSWKTDGNFLEVENSIIDKIYSGDGITPSTEVTVELKTSILKLSKGDQIVIDNIPVFLYNGYQTISEIIEMDSDSNVTKFKYQLPSIPDIASPTLNESSEVLFVINNSEVTSASSSYYYEYWDEGYGYPLRISSSSFIKPVTNYEYEIAIEDEKRNIFVLKPQYLNVVFNDMDLMMKYKNGGAQYVNATMKRGDNIRLYE